MTKYTIGILFIFFSQLINAQIFIGDSLLTTALYDEQYNSYTDNREYNLANLLMPHTLSSLVDSQIINKTDMQGLSLPMGINNSNDTVNFTIGMVKMWQKKTEWMLRKKRNANTELMLLSLKFIHKNMKQTEKSSLRNFRSTNIKNAIEKTQFLHKKMKPLYSEQRKIFMDIIINNLTPNVILAYNIQELIPPSHFTKNKELKNINPLFKCFYYDRLLRKAGLEFIEGFPSRYDNLISLGPYQLTYHAIDDINANNRLVSDFHRFNSVKTLKNINDHILAATFFAYSNWERLSMVLNRKKVINKFNQYFSDYKTNTEKQKKLRIFIAGITACMHHQPSPTRTFVNNYLSKNKDYDKIHYECIQHYGTGKQLKKYYKSSAQAYLLLKVWHILEDQYIHDFINAFANDYSNKHYSALSEYFMKKTITFNQLIDKSQLIDNIKTKLQDIKTIELEKYEILNLNNKYEQNIKLYFQYQKKKQKKHQMILLLGLSKIKYGYKIVSIEFP